MSELATLRERHRELCFTGKERASIARLQHDFRWGVCRNCGQKQRKTEETDEAEAAARKQTRI